MALKVTLGRWIAVAATSCAVLATWQLVTAPPSWPDAAFGPAMMYGWGLRPDAGTFLQRDLFRLRLLQLRDSVLGQSRRNADASRAPLTVLVDQAIADSTSRQLRAMAERQWRALAPPGRVPVLLAFVLDTVRNVQGQGRSPTMQLAADDFLPTAADPRCYVQARVPDLDHARSHQWTARQRQLVLRSRPFLFGMCAYLSAFGAPGAHVQQWLRGDNWAPAQYADWDRVSVPSGFSLASQFENPVDAFFGTAGTWRIRMWLDPLAIGCVAGRPGSCTRAMLASTVSPADSSWSGAVASSARFYRGGFGLRERYSGLGPEREELTSDMVAAMGRERFQQFWSSALPVDSAFRIAAGADMETWVQRWLRRRYGTDTVGPTLSASALASGLAFAAAAFGLALLLASRRRIRAA